MANLERWMQKDSSEMINPATANTLKNFGVKMEKTSDPKFPIKLDLWGETVKLDDNTKSLQAKDKWWELVLKINNNDWTTEYAKVVDWRLNDANQMDYDDAPTWWNQQWASLFQMWPWSRYAIVPNLKN